MLSTKHKTATFCQTASPETGAPGYWRLSMVFLMIGWLILQIGQRPDQYAPPGVPLLDLPCVSYAPFRRPGATPFDPSLTVSAQQIKEDLRALQHITRCVRTYGVDHGLDQVPALARLLGLKVKLGVWISSSPSDNQSQLLRGISLSHQFSDVVDELIVGNEVLLRGDLTASQLRELILQAKATATVAVSYADVWEFWLQHAQLASAVDRVAVHILPYWENDPVGIDKAVAHIVAVFHQVTQRFAPKPVWIAETGWPSIGRQRGPARPGIVEQARLVGELHSSPELRATEFNVIEGFDQPWKKRFEGAMGAGWGVFGVTGEAKSSLAKGAPSFKSSTITLGLAGLLGVIGAAISRRQRPAIEVGMTTVLCFCSAVMAAQYIEAWSQGWLGVATWLLGFVLLSSSAWFLRNATVSWVLVLAWLLVLGLGVGYLLWFHAHSRYLGFPTALLWPVLAALMLRPQGLPITPRLAFLIGGLQVALAILAIWMLTVEGWINGQALEFACVVVLISLIGLTGLLRARVSAYVTDQEPAR